MKEAPDVKSLLKIEAPAGRPAKKPLVTLPDGRADIASVYFPLTGPYDSRDMNVRL